MEYTSKLFSEFIENLIEFDKSCKSVIEGAEFQVNNRIDDEKSQLSISKNQFDSKVQDFSTENTNLIRECNDEIESILEEDIKNKRNLFEHLQKCKEVLSAINNVEKYIASVSDYESIARFQSVSSSMTLNEVMSGTDSFINLAYEIETAIRVGKKREKIDKMTQLYGMCRRAEEVLNAEIARLRMSIFANKDSLHSNYEKRESDFYKEFKEKIDINVSDLNDITKEFITQRDKIKSDTRTIVDSSTKGKKAGIDSLVDKFCKKFSPKEFANEYFRIYSSEPIFDNYECVKEMPRNVYISTLEYDISQLELCEYTKEFLDKYYYFMYREEKLLIPHCAQFNSEFNFIFKFNGEERSNVVKDACEMGMRLFMMIPPGKVNFTFIDPVTLGESFAMFTRLVDSDDRTSEIINGKIWFTQSDIEDKLRIMTNHISNVTQRCLQGKYNNIFEYNQVAEKNAEAYQILMLMDYPAGLSDQSLRLLEQIVTSGPKCGVFTVIYRNESQYKKISEKFYPLIENIEANFQKFNYADDAKKIICTNEAIKTHEFIWHGIRMPNEERMNEIISKLKLGIKYADKVVIGFEKLDNAEKSDSTKDGIRIPIGIHGANEVQYLTLGVGGSHHALIAGITRSGKSSLLHTIIMGALTQYQSPDELNIYLVDFKRGVEFKIYADHILPVFKVIAIETEREFGYSILETLEREQKIRADLFKKKNVYKIQEYRDLPDYNELPKMPRIILIMDEFHELFSDSNDEIGRKSSVIMERIVKQGAAFGIHLIFSSQSYLNVRGLDKAVLSQMAVRIVLKCSKDDANLLLDGQSAEIDQISIDDPGRAVYNSEAGNKEYNSHFRVAYIEPEKREKMLKKISNLTKKYEDKKHPTRVLLSNIEDNKNSIFNQFKNETLKRNSYETFNRLHIGEPLNASNSMEIDFTHSECSNLLMVGEDTEKARSMFAFSILSLCINYKIVHKQIPEQPFIYLYNCKPLDDSYFEDTLKLLAELLPEYINYVGCGETNKIQNIVSELYEDISKDVDTIDIDKYFLVFGYQRAEDLKSENKMGKHEEANNSFNIISGDFIDSRLSINEMFHAIVKEGAMEGIHTIIWQDRFNALYQDDREIMSYFSMRIAFDMSEEEYSRFISAYGVSSMSENNAIYYNKMRDNQKFRPYRSPSDDWLKSISKKLK